MSPNAPSHRPKRRKMILVMMYTKYFPNNVINSITLKEAIASISDQLGVPLPVSIRYFRSQMQTIITKACKELSIKPIPSKRCVSYETIYTRHPGFQKGSKPFLSLDYPFPRALPENLFAIREEISSVNEKFSFGASLDLDLLGLEIDYNTLIPGLAMKSSRAMPLAGMFCISFSLDEWLEVCTVETDTARGRLLLSVGISTRYTYATYQKTPVATQEAKAWEAAKNASRRLHFLAIQEDLDGEDCIGYWLLLDLPPPPL
ncbi:TAB2 homolog, chloroplastic-like protein [Drosera capensis]